MSAKAEGEYKVANAGLRIVDAEIAEVGLRIEQLRRRRDRIKRVIARGRSGEGRRTGQVGQAFSLTPINPSGWKA